MAAETITTRSSKAIADNSQFTQMYQGPANAAGTKKYVITSQTPKAGTLVWPGTVIEVEMEDRDAIVVGAFTGIASMVKDKYRVVGDLRADLEKDPDVRVIIEENHGYPPSSPVAKEKADRYISAKYGVDADKEKVYNDIAFLVNI